MGKTDGQRMRERERERDSGYSGETGGQKMREIYGESFSRERGLRERERERERERLRLQWGNRWSKDERFMERALVEKEVLEREKLTVLANIEPPNQTA